VPHEAYEFATADFNGDCIPDLAVGGYGGPGEGVSVLFGNADGGFGLPQALPTHGTGPLTILGPVSSPQALAASVVCCDAVDLIVYGDASRH
jgi:isocitrate dehydrogenase